MVSLPLDDPRAAHILGWMADHFRRFPKEYEAAKIVTLNRVGVTLNKNAIKKLTDRYAAKRGDIARKINVSKASSARPFVMVHGQGRPLHLGLWPGGKASVRKNDRKYRGAKVQVLKGGGRKLVKGGFAGVSGRNQASMIFKRQGASRHPIEALYGPSMIGHLTQPENQEPLMTLARNNLETELRRQAQFRLKKLGIL